MSDKINRPSKAELKKQLSPEAYAVTQEAATERPFTGQYDNFYEDGKIGRASCRERVYVLV